MLTPLPRGFCLIHHSHVTGPGERLHNARVQKKYYSVYDYIKNKVPYIPLYNKNIIS